MKTLRMHAWLILLSLPTAFARADVIYLKDGTSLVGSVRKTDDGWNVRTKNEWVRVAVDQVESIELTPSTKPGMAIAVGRLLSLRRSVENVNDLPTIIARFQRFVDQDSDPVTKGDAKKDLAIWLDRQDHKMVKVGTRWVLPAERDQLVAQAQVEAENARQLMKQGRTREAQPILSNVLLVDPQNPSALYLTGILYYQQDQVPAARKAFEGVMAAIPNHGPTLNNLAILLWRQKQYLAAVNNFDAAMLASPVNQLILDNTANALQSLSPDMQKTPIAVRAIRHFQEQDQQLAEQMSRAGLRRFGSIWVSEKEMVQAKVDEKQIQDKLDQLSGDFNQQKDRVDQLDQNISDNQIQMHRIEATSSIADPRTGIILSVAYPAVYYTLQSDNEKMLRERAGHVNQLDLLKKQANNLESSRPSNKNRGVQIMFGAESTPLRIASPPATRPVQK